MRLAVAAALLLPLAGCGDDGTVCTLIGCDEASAVVRVDGLPAGRAEVRVCIDDVCRTARLQRPRQVANVPLDELPPGDRARMLVELRVRGRVVARGAIEAPIRASRPNGPDCPPECRQALARLDVATGRLEAG